MNNIVGNYIVVCENAAASRPFLRYFSTIDVYFGISLIFGYSRITFADSLKRRKFRSFVRINIVFTRDGRNCWDKSSFIIACVISVVSVGNLSSLIDEKHDWTTEFVTCYFSQYFVNRRLSGCGSWKMQNCREHAHYWKNIKSRVERTRLCFSQLRQLHKDVKLFFLTKKLIFIR